MLTALIILAILATVACVIALWRATPNTRAPANNDEDGKTRWFLDSDGGGGGF